jgi:hypothetical protein
MSKQKSCGVVVACGFRSRTGRQGVPTKTTADERAIESDARMCNTKLSHVGRHSTFFKTEHLPVV